MNIVDIESIMQTNQTRFPMLQLGLQQNPQPVERFHCTSDAVAGSSLHGGKCRLLRGR